MHLLVFDRPLGKDEHRSARGIAKSLRGWYDAKQGGYMMRSAEDAESLAKAMFDEEVVESTQPVSLADTRKIVEVQQESQSANPSGNKLVTDERYAELRERMRKKLGGQMNMGVDPEILAIGTEMAVYHIEKGARKFSEYAKDMISDLGDAIRPYLKAFYNGARELPEVEDDVMLRTSEEIEAVNDRYNSDLQRWHSGSLSTNEYISVGNPQGILTALMPNVPIILRQKVLTKAVKKHYLTADEVMNLPAAISSPIFIFQSNPNSISILTELTNNEGKNIFVAIELGTTKQIGHNFIEVNDILTIHDREIENIIFPIKENETLKWVDKNKGLSWLSSVKTNSQAITKKDLEVVAKLIKQFDNSTIEDNIFANRQGEGAYCRVQQQMQN